MRVARRTGLVLLVLGVVCPTAPAQEPIPLGQAVEEGKVEAEITGLGGSTGDAIQVCVRRKVPQILRLTLAPGTVFKSTSGNAQDMVAAGIKGERVGEMTYRPTSQIVLSDDAEHRFVVEAFCLDFHKPNPTSKHAFALSPSDVRAAAVLSLGKEKAASMKVIQSALWIDRERVTDTELKRRFSVNAEEIEQARQLIQETQRARDIGRRGSPASATVSLACRAISGQ